MRDVFLWVFMFSLLIATVTTDWFRDLSTYKTIAIISVWGFITTIGAMKQ